LISENKHKLCFSFNKGDNILIYTKIIEENIELIDINASTKSNNLSHMSSIIRDIYDFENYTQEELINYLINNYYYKENDLKDKNLDQLKYEFIKVISEHYNISFNDPIINKIISLNNLNRKQLINYLMVYHN